MNTKTRIQGCIRDFNDDVRFDFASHKLPLNDITGLLHFFEKMIEKSEAAGLIHADYNTSEFPEAKGLGIAGYSLGVERFECDTAKGLLEYWVGKYFQDGGWLEVRAPVPQKLNR